MLVVSRERGQAVVIGYEENGKLVEIATVRVLSKALGTRLKIGVEAAENIKVHRQEIWDQLKALEVR